MRRGRVLGIDAGERRIGVALSDELRVLASPLIVLDRRRGLSVVLDQLAALALREGVVQVVVGLPLNADGSRGPQARRAQDFARVASRVLGVPVSMWDERLSTREAESILREQGGNLRRARQTGARDAGAAAVILQDYLDHSSAEGPRRGPAASSVDEASEDAPPADAPSQQPRASADSDSPPPGKNR